MYAQHHLSLPADTRRVHESVGSAPSLEHGVDRVARGARHIADDGPCLPEQPVKET